jgi:hypothetical protein
MDKKYSFLPDIKRSTDSSSFIKNSINKDEEFLEASVDKFSTLTNQPRNLESIKLTSFKQSNQNRLSLVNKNPSNPNSTPLNFKWDVTTPKLKITKAIEFPIAAIESHDQRKKRLMFEQKVFLEQKTLQKELKHMKSIEYLKHSQLVRNDLEEKKGLFNNDNENSNLTNRKSNYLLFDVWSSHNIKDINLNNEIINKFYTLDNRRIRYYQKERPNYFNYNKSTNELDKKEKKDSKLIDSATFLNFE